MDGLGLPHPRSYGTFPRVIAKYVREDKAITLENAIRKMSGWPATRMRLAERGYLREGFWADVVIFDYDTIKDVSTYDSPVAYPGGDRLRAGERGGGGGSREAHRSAAGEGSVRTWADGQIGRDLPLATGRRIVTA